MRRRGAADLDEVRWSLLCDTLRARRLLPTLGPRIVELAQGRAGEQFEAAVDDALTAGRHQGTYLQMVAIRMMQALFDSGIRCSALKGPLLSEAIYGDPGRRLSSDIDLLVPAERLQDAIAAVRRIGYAAPSDYVLPDGRPLLHFVLAHESGDLPPIELHWRVHWYERDFARERLLPDPGEDRADWRPACADELASLLLFYARDGFVDLRLAADIGAWWDVYGDSVSPGALDEIAASFPALARALAVAVTVAENVVGIPAARVWTSSSPVGLRGRLAARLANPHPRTSQSQLYADMGLVDGLLAPNGDFRAFARRQLLPPHEVLSEQAHHAAKERTRSAIGHCVGALTRYGVTIARTFRGPTLSR
ncbi:MAG TPA: nucleotidyltransferase family protein [Solirubrobacteraceae bacterium]|nr:nucleotidyltransferase family protein [Solirubrobacteraceae bacterium]